MKPAVRSSVFRFLVRLGVVPADSVLLYDDTCFEWHSGFGEFATVLYALVRSGRPETVVEIGSAYGKSTCFIAAALQRNRCGKLFSIDPHTATEWNDGQAGDDTFATVGKRLRQLRLTPYVEQWRMKSSEAAASWSEAIDILLIDGSHSYDDVRADFFSFLPHVKPGGLILFHDTMWDHRKNERFCRPDMGVPRVVQELQDSGYPMVTLRESWGLTILQNVVGGYPLVRREATPGTS